jgi:hypothetical protein
VPHHSTQSDPGAGLTVLGFIAASQGTSIHYAGTWNPNSSTAKVWINGVEHSSASGFQAPQNTENVRIGLGLRLPDDGV